MPDNTLRIAAEADMGQAVAALNAGADATKQAIGRMLVSFQEASTGTARAVSKIAEDTRSAAATVGPEWQRLAQATVAYRNALQEVAGASYLAKKAGQDNAETMRVLAAANEKAAVAARELAAAQEAAGVGMQQLHGHTDEARGAMALLGEETGVRIPRHLRGFIADLPGVGAAFSAAFSVFAVVGLIEVLGHLGEKVVEVGAALFHWSYGWDFQLEEMKKDTDALAESWKDFLVSLNTQKLSIDLVGLSGAAKLRGEIGNTGKEIDLNVARMAELQKKADELNETLSGKHTEQRFISLEPPVMGDFEVGNTAGLSKEEVEGKREELKKLNVEIQKFQEHIAELRQVKLPVQQKELRLGLDDHGKTEKDERLQQWKQELQAKQDAEDGLHELSKADEAAFWEAKLALAKVGSKLYRDVLHELRQADREEMKESLKTESDVLRDRVAKTKEGSLERLIILNEELAHLKSLGADETEFFKRVQAQASEAEIKYKDETAKAAVQADRQKVESTRRASDERVAAERVVLEHLKALGLEGTHEYTAQLQRVTAAELAAHAEKQKLAELDIEQDKIRAISGIEVRRPQVQSDFDQHRINGQQRIALLKDLENQEYEIEKEALEKRLALLRNDPTVSPVELQRIYNQIENLTREHNNKLASLNTQGVQNQQKIYDQFFSHTTAAFTSVIDAMVTGQRNGTAQMIRAFQQMELAFINSLVRMAAQEVIGLALHKTVAAQGVMVDAKKAASGAYAATSDIPVVGPFLAPVAAAAAFAATIAFGSFHAGGIADTEQMAILKRNEMVLDPVLSAGFQKILGSGTAPAAPSTASGHRVWTGDMNIHGVGDPQAVADLAVEQVKTFFRTGGVHRR